MRGYPERKLGEVHKGLTINLDSDGRAVRGEYERINTHYPDPKDSLNSEGHVRVVLPLNLEDWATQFEKEDENGERAPAIFLHDESDDAVGATLSIASVASVGVSLEEAQQQPGGVFMLCLGHDEIRWLHSALSLIIANRP